MSVKSLEQSCNSLIEAIHSRNLTIKPEYLQEKPKSGVDDRPSIFRIPFYICLIERFGSGDLNLWLEYLNDDEYKPDWYIVEINLETRLFNDDYQIQVYESREEAIAHVMEQLEWQRYYRHILAANHGNTLNLGNEIGSGF